MSLSKHTYTWLLKISEKVQNNDTFLNDQFPHNFFIKLVYSIFWYLRFMPNMLKEKSGDKTFIELERCMSCMIPSH